ncbi:TetR/AcrR family transcriptional regulator [Phytoactinopolyspora endophytica]|uniref:TetR/AcrR family transcriptional regulator n=1 Tax=Phytoactinopolyspora endophytica TaxID=1642495 RepID=UPI0013EDC115|nr:TetR/AcrR family transcriptional regulator [Phytoactinopolyspora endophytica]
MSEPSQRAGSLRERKQQRARQAIIDAALSLFAEKGFDQVTVTDIAERAEVGRSTFFRYFGDKQEVVFAGDTAAETVEKVASQLPVDRPIGDSLPAALGCVRTVVVLFAETLTEHADMYTLHQQLVDQHPELYARSLQKQRAYAEAMTKMLVERGSDQETATLAAEIGIACYYAGQAAAGDAPQNLPGAVEAAFARL